MKQIFNKMYELVDKEMVKSGIANRLDTEVMLDCNGKITTNEDDAFGRKPKYVLMHPNMVLFINEVGDNTSQKNYGNIGGQSLLWRTANKL